MKSRASNIFWWKPTYQNSRGNFPELYRIAALVPGEPEPALFYFVLFLPYISFECLAAILSSNLARAPLRCPEFLAMCKMFMFRLSGAPVSWRWMVALIPVDALEYCLAFLCFPFSEELSHNFTQVRWTYCFEIHCNPSFLTPFLELSYTPLSFFLGVLRLSFLLSFIQFLVV